MKIKCLLSVLLCGLLAGCSLIFVEHKTRYRDAEGYFETDLLTQIRLLQTTGTWVREHFGSPWSVSGGAAYEYPEELQINTWRFQREKQKVTRVFLIFRSRHLSEQYEYLHVITDNDIVVRAWRDELETVDVPRIMTALGYKRVRAAPAEISENAAVPVPVTDISEGASAEPARNSAESPATNSP